MQHDCYLIEAERAVFGLDHAAVGSALAGWWKFPKAMQDAVADHHRDDHGGKPSLGLAVHAANILAHGLDLSDIEDDLVPPLSEAVWAALALDEAASLALFREAEATFNEMCQILVN
jgi:HD-like signal output (HDOD) protein